MDKNINEEYASLALKRFYDTATENIQKSALVNRALTDKVSTDTINKKVNNQLSSIHESMYRINSKFNENSKNYDVIKKEILSVLTDYEAALIEYSDFYDIKLEQLILRKVELESHLVGKIFKEEDFKKVENKKEKERANDKLRISFAEKSKNLFEKVSLKKKDNIINIQEINRLQDSLDLEEEQDKKLAKNIDKIKEKNKTNISEIQKIESEINGIKSEIKKINERKRLALEEAMETKEQWIAINTKKPTALSRIKRFFSGKFNTSKLILNTVINPLKFRVADFRENELVRLKE